MSGLILKKYFIVLQDLYRRIPGNFDALTWTDANLNNSLNNDRKQRATMSAGASH